MRQIILDTETTGLDPQQGHRLIEIGCLELVNRRLTQRSFHHYVNPEREIDAGASAIHGIYDKDVADKPRFADIAPAFLDFVKGAELIIHNAPFDIGFINHEFQLLNRGWSPITDYFTVLDTLVMARAKHPGQKNTLDALARRYGADQRDRTYHGALLDSEILADVYLAMTGGQVGLALGQDETQSNGEQSGEGIRRLPANRTSLPVIKASTEELARHEAKLKTLDKSADGCLWHKIEPSSD